MELDQNYLQDNGKIGKRAKGVKICATKKILDSMTIKIV